MVTKQMRGRIPRRVPKLSSAEIARMKNEREARVVELVARNRVKFTLDAVDQLPVEVKEALAEVTGKTLDTFAAEVKEVVERKVEENKAKKVAKDDLP